MISLDNLPRPAVLALLHRAAKAENNIGCTIGPVRISSDPACQQIVPAMSQHGMQDQEAVDGGALATDGYSPAGEAPPPATRLLDLPPVLLDDIACRVMQLGATSQLPLTCRAFSLAHLLHVPALRIKLCRQRCDQLLTPRVVAALRARECKLAITLEQQRVQGSTLMTEVLKKLGICTAVKTFKLSSLEDPSLAPRTALDCSPSLAQCLVNSFPGLTSLGFLGYSTTCSGLAALLSHPQLSLQLQQLDLSSTTILKFEQPEPGAATLTGTDIFSLLTDVAHGFDSFTAALQSLAQLQVLTISGNHHMAGLHGLLQALPQLHTLQLPQTGLWGHEQVDALLAATQLTSIQLSGSLNIYISRADAPCSWQRLELTDSCDCSSAAYLPLHSLTQPLVLGELTIETATDDCTLVAAAVHNLTQACRVPVRIGGLSLDMSDVDTAVQQQVQLQQLVAVLQALKGPGRMHMSLMNVGVAEISILTPLCLGRTQLVLSGGRLTPTLEFWRQLVELMPTVTDVVFEHYVEGSTSSAMHESLQLMAEQPWARWLDICISRPRGSSELPACWLADNPSKPGKLRVWFKA
ncbi:hypothetical protein QJQ45_015676 [Haematococcus lacustris]|nr:hypothetical protein QJQ45_015676 [Haematococcus lacustris]